MDHWIAVITTCVAIRLAEIRVPILGHLTNCWFMQSRFISPAGTEGPGPVRLCPLKYVASGGLIIGTRLFNFPPQSPAHTIFTHRQ